MLPDFSAARLLVVGDVMLDRYWQGSTSRISPEAPVPVVNIRQDEERVGGAGNVALNAAALGVRTALLGLAGQDAAADRIEALLAQRQVACRLQRVAGSKTITKLRVLSHHQQLIRLDFEDAFPHWDAAALEADFRAGLGDVDTVVLSDYAKGALRQCGRLIALARAAGKSVIVDPKGTDFQRYRGATVITPNLAEFEAVVGRCATEAEIEGRGVALREALDLDAVLVTRSEKGMTLLARGQAPLHLSTRAQEVFDVTGAGDTVVATLGAALAAGMPMPEAVALANIAAGVVVAKLGTATLSPAELHQAMLGSREADRRGVCGEEALVPLAALARARGERLVLAHGGFDILHPGHVDFLERARGLGDRLIVAVRDDAAVRRIEGGGRPVNPLAARMRLVAALACVDWVVPLTEDAPERLACRVLPDILVLGDDGPAAGCEGARCVRAAGGQVRSLERLPGYSTGDLMDRIRKGTP